MNRELNNLLVMLEKSACNLVVNKPWGYNKNICAMTNQIEHRFINGDDFILAREYRRNGKSKFTIEIETA